MIALIRCSAATTVLPTSDLSNSMMGCLLTLSSAILISISLCSRLAVIYVDSCVLLDVATWICSEQPVLLSYDLYCTVACCVVSLMAVVTIGLCTAHSAATSVLSQNDGIVRLQCSCQSLRTHWSGVSSSVQQLCAA